MDAGKVEEANPLGGSNFNLKNFTGKSITLTVSDGRRRGNEVFRRAGDTQAPPRSAGVLVMHSRGLYVAGAQSVLTYATVNGLLVGWDLRSPKTAWRLKNDPKHGKPDPVLQV